MSGLVPEQPEGRGWLPKVRAIVARTEWMAPRCGANAEICAELDVQLTALNGQLLTLVREDPDVRRRVTVSGVGAHTGLA